MIKFRQKEFIAPIIAAAVPAVIQGGAGLIQGKKANESQEKLAEFQNKQAEKDRRAQQRIANQQTKLQQQQTQLAQKQQDQLIKLAKKNPEAAAAVKPTITIGQSQEQSKTFSKVGAVLGGAANLGMGALNSGAVTTAMSMKMNKDQLKSNEKIATQENENRALETRARVRENNNATALKMQELKNQKNEFNKSYKLARKQKAYSKVKEGAGFIKNLGTIAKGRGLNKVLAAAAVTGAVSGTGSYLVDKAIQRDAKKSGILKVEKPELTEEEIKAKKKKRNRKLLLTAGTTAALVGTGIAAKKGKLGTDMKDIANKVTFKSVKDKAKSGARTIKEATKDYFAPVDERTGKRRPDTLNLAITGVSTAAPAVMYALKKKQLKDQIKQSESDADNNTQEEEKTYSKIRMDNISGGFKKAASSIGEKFNNNSKNKKEYKGTVADTILRARTKKLYSPKGRTERYKVKDWWGKFKNKPGETLLDTLSFRTGGGGKKGVKGFGEDLVKIGKETGNETSQKVGKYIKDNPEKAMLGSAVLGFGVIRTAKRKLGGATSKALEKVDPNAYAYAKYGAQPIPSKDKEEREYE